jgi:IS605 OrfB family transposase
VSLLKKDNKLSKLKMRDKIKQEMRNNNYLYTLQKNSGIYQQSIDFSVFDVFKARKTAFTNLKQKNIKFFRLRYKKKSHHIKTMCINPKNAINKLGTGFKKDGLGDLSPSEKIISSKDTRMGYNSRTKKFSMYVPYDKEYNERVTRSKICALDPGIRTFQTLYSPAGITYQFGDENNVIKRNIDKIESVREFKNKKWYKKYTDKLRIKLKNRIADLHWKTASFLCKNFDTILVGNMSTKGIVKKGSMLARQTKRMTYALSHFLFKERLISKASEFNCVVKVVDESYTSKTCGGCGEINENLGSSKQFICPRYMCLYRMNRDIHGARNIYIKNS